MSAPTVRGPALGSSLSCFGTRPRVAEPQTAAVGSSSALLDVLTGVEQAQGSSLPVARWARWWRRHGPASFWPGAAPIGAAPAPSSAGAQSPLLAMCCSAPSAVQPQVTVGRMYRRRGRQVGRRVSEGRLHRTHVLMGTPLRLHRSSSRQPPASARLLPVRRPFWGAMAVWSAQRERGGRTGQKTAQGMGGACASSGQLVAPHSAPHLPRRRGLQPEPVPWPPRRGSVLSSAGAS